MKSALNVVRCRGMPILRQLQVEEVLLRHTGKNWFLINRGMSDVSIVMGFGGKPLELIDIDRVQASAAQGKNIKVIRRYTGGGTVIVDDKTVFTSFIMNANDVPSRPYPREIMTWSETIFKPVFEGREGSNGTASANTIPNDSGSNGTGTGVLFALRENDYVIDNLKIGGNAQCIVKDRWVHHTSFLWDYAVENMQFLLMPKKRPEYRQDRKHSSFLDKIKNHITSPQALEDRVVNQLERVFDVTEVTQAQIEMVIAEISLSPSFLKQPDVRTRLEDVNAYDRTAAPVATAAVVRA
jgi:lipoate-protein ligase A